MMNFKEWLLFKAKNAGERSDFHYNKGQPFSAAVEAGKEDAYKEIAECKFINSGPTKSSEGENTS